jgi:hypothetical protein
VKKCPNHSVQYYLPFEANIKHVAVPKVRPVTYPQATVKNTSDYALPPGHGSENALRSCAALRGAGVADASGTVLAERAG